MLPSLYVAAKLDIATLLQKEPLTAKELAAQLHVDPSNLARILRALASQGIFKQTSDDRFALNSLARGLLDEPGSLRQMILHHLGPVNWNLMSNLEYSVRTGKDAFSDKYGLETYQYLRTHPQEQEVFDGSMSNLSDLGLAPVLHAYSFSKFLTIADIGGGEGFLLANILQHNPSCRGILFDTPEALEKAPEMLNRHQVADRTEIVPGDFFRDIPKSCTLYILKNIIHNWGDEQSAVILSNIRNAMGPDGVLLIIEMVVPAGNVPSLAKLLDIQMMASMQGGRERTEMEYREILEKTGFTLTRIIPTIAPISLIEARKNG